MWTSLSLRVVLLSLFYFAKKVDPFVLLYLSDFLDWQVIAIFYYDFLPIYTFTLLIIGFSFTSFLLFLTCFILLHSPIAFSFHLVWFAMVLVSTILRYDSLRGKVAFNFFSTASLQTLLLSLWRFLLFFLFPFIFLVLLLSFYRLLLLRLNNFCRLISGTHDLFLRDFFTILRLSIKFCWHGQCEIVGGEWIGTKIIDMWIAIMFLMSKWA